MIGYKIVRPYSRESTLMFRSLTQNGFNAVMYPVGEKAFPHEGCGPLAVFDELAHVYLYLQIFRVWGGYAIWKCDYTPAQGNYLWNKYETKYNLPLGTVLASSVTLLEPITKIPHGNTF